MLPNAPSLPACWPCSGMRGFPQPPPVVSDRTSAKVLCPPAPKRMAAAPVPQDGSRPAALRLRTPLAHLPRTPWGFPSLSEPISVRDASHLGCYHVPLVFSFLSVPLCTWKYPSGHTGITPSLLLTPPNVHIVTSGSWVTEESPHPWAVEDPWFPWSGFLAPVEFILLCSARHGSSLARSPGPRPPQHCISNTRPFPTGWSCCLYSRLHFICN